MSKSDVSDGFSTDGPKMLIGKGSRFWDDSSELKEAKVALSTQKELLAQEKNRFEMLLNGLNQSAIVATADRNGDITFANDLFCRISGYSREELMGSNHRILNSSFHPPAFFKEMWQSISNGNLWRGDVCNRKKDGSIYWVDTCITRITDTFGEMQYMAIRYDITARKDAEAKLVLSAKLASMGELAAGIAHEVNNPLAIILGMVSQLERFQNDPEKFAAKIKSIENAAERIKKIVMGLKKFSGDSSGLKHTVQNLAQVVRDTMSFTEAYSLRFDTPVTFHSQSDDLYPIECNEVEIEQVLINLINNSIDAVKGNEEKWVNIDLYQDAQTVTLKITDSGLGISPELHRRIFDPFFTTKVAVGGTGLGLSITRGILDAHGASIQVVSESPNTCFEIRFSRKETA